MHTTLNNQSYGSQLIKSWYLVFPRVKAKRPPEDWLEQSHSGANCEVVCLGVWSQDQQLAAACLLISKLWESSKLKCVHQTHNPLQNLEIHPVLTHIRLELLTADIAPASSHQWQWPTAWTFSTSLYSPLSRVHTRSGTENRPWVLMQPSKTFYVTT